ncbi:hypothetical protein [Streptomyces sp. TRM75563]|uniref:hypothetical protein n=1 Tax=Streptomyces sp. TRM75563 TaxID=2817418 RepID=UPI001F604626|nr:hypothetical protein [Streptomyces sp. TRM75563]MCI4042338.1 hypothetical protein [Streptomyces sp. TRM75563]
MYCLSHPSASRRRRRQLITAVALLTCRHRASPSRRHRPEPPRADRPFPPSPRPHRVTPVTGDVVTVTTSADGRQTADVDRPDGAVGGVKLQEVKGDLFVIPDEVGPLLGTGKLDRRLPDSVSIRSA